MRGRLGRSAANVKIDRHGSTGSCERCAGDYSDPAASTIERLKADGGRLLKARMDDAAGYCANELIRKMLTRE